MSKTLLINCGNALILRWSPEVFEAYEKIVINAGQVIMSRQVNAGLNQKQATINAGNTRLLEVTGPVLDLGDQTYLPEASNYKGSYLAFNEDLVLRPTDATALEEAAGLFVGGTLYRPSSMPLQGMEMIEANKTVVYPDDAYLVRKELIITTDSLFAMPENHLVWSTRNMFALDEAAMEAAKQQGLRFQCKKLVACQSILQRYGDILSAEQVVTVPDGCALVKDLVLTPAALAMYGENLYVQGSLTLRRQDMDCLAQAHSLTVEGCAYLPVESVAAFRKIGSSGSLFAYEGELLRINGDDTITHKQLDAARQAGISYTIQANGRLQFADDIQPEDLETLLALYYNGVVQVPEHLKALVQSKVVRGKGTLTAADDSTMDGLMKTLGVSADDISYINVGNYRLV